MICAKPLIRLLEYMLSAVDNMRFHQSVIPQACEQFGCDEKILTCVFIASDFNHTLVNHALISRIHTLVNLIDNAEWGLCEGLEGHQVKDSRDRSLTTRLTVLVEDLEAFALPMKL